MGGTVEMNSAFTPVTKVNLKLLQTFVLVAKHSSFRQVADDTYRCQSAISAQIKQLEKQLGVSLFHRTTRRVRLTADGEQLLSSTQPALEEIDLALRRIQQSVDRRRDRIRFGCSLWIAASGLASILSEFEREFSNISVLLREARSADLLEGVRWGDLEFATGAITAEPDLDVAPIMNEDFYAVLSNKFKAARQSQITLKELSTLPMLLRNPSTAHRRLIDSVMQSRNLEFHTKYEVSETQTVLSMAAAGLGVGILPRSALPKKWERGMSVLHIVEPTISRQIAIFKLKSRQLSPASLRLVQLIRRFFDPAKEGPVFQTSSVEGSKQATPATVSANGSTPARERRRAQR